MILIVDLSTHKLSMSEFVNPIKDIIDGAGLISEIKHYTEDYNPQDYDKIILCGSALKDSEHLNDLDRFKWLKTTDRPVLGICAGMQTIGAVFGERIVKVKEIGMTDIHVKKENKLLDEDITVYTLHHLAIDCSEMEVLAASEKCVHAIRKGDIYGILFHPEVRNKKIIKKFLAN